MTLPAIDAPSDPFFTTEHTRAAAFASAKSSTGFWISAKAACRLHRPRHTPPASVLDLGAGVTSEIFFHRHAASLLRWRGHGQASTAPFQQVSPSEARRVSSASAAVTCRFIPRPRMAFKTLDSGCRAHLDVVHIENVDLVSTLRRYLFHADDHLGSRGRSWPDGWAAASYDCAASACRDADGFWSYHPALHSSASVFQAAVLLDRRSGFSTVVAGPPRVD